MVFKAEETANKLIETDNRQSITDAKVHNIFRNMIYGCLYCEIIIKKSGQTTGYTVLGCNNAMNRIMGSVLARSLDQLVKVFFKQVDLLPVLAKAALNGIPSVWEQYFDTQQKWYYISAFSVEKGSAVLLLEDITQRKSLEKELEASRKRYEALVKQSSDAVALVDAVSKKILEVNLSLCQMTGYSEEELCQLSLYNLFADKKAQIDVCQTELAKKHYLPVTNRNVNCKDGTTIEVERVVSLVNYNSHQLELVTLYDISEERKLQQIINEDAAVASQVQRQMLPLDYRNKTMEIKGIYKPLHVVSGDFYDYRFSEDKSVLMGFLVDVAGHGLATALQTAAINVLLQEVIIREKMPTESELQALNKRMMGYFDEGSFAALLLFNFDFQQKTLTCAYCGINQILAFCSVKRGWIKAKGSIMGTFDAPQFDFVKVPIQAGDCFYFLTDGISEKLTESVLDNLGDFPIASGMLAELANSRGIEDDCSAVCIKLKGSSEGCRYYFSGMEDAATIQEKLRHTLTEMAGSQALYLEIALNEAINNILLHGSSNGYVKIKRIGRRVVLRVKDCKQGFNVQTVLKQFRTKSTEEIAETVSSQETGRGLLIMKLFTDKIYYNRSGSEIMLVYNDDRSEINLNPLCEIQKKPQISYVS